MSEPVPKSPEMGPEPAEDPWHDAFVEFKDRDEKMVKDYQEEIDTLLVFVRGPHRLFARALTTLVHRPASSRLCSLPSWSSLIQIFRRTRPR
jgi:hypothetical protein